MILTDLIGGLGNQMFQYAAALGLACRSGVEMRYDDGAFANYTLRRFSLSDLCISSRRVSLHEHVRISEEGRLFKEEGSHYNSALLCRHRCAYLKGYWQSEKYFSNVRARLLSEFIPAFDVGDANREVIARMRRHVSVAVHVRRGDYVSNTTTNAVHGILPPHYYREASSQIRARVNAADPGQLMFFVFSDDPDWCQENLDFLQPMEIMRNNSSDQGALDIYLMRHCRHHIIANSSFSWWGAWLNEDPEQIVIAPKSWFRSVTLEADHIVPERWHRI